MTAPTHLRIEHLERPARHHGAGPPAVLAAARRHTAEQGRTSSRSTASTAGRVESAASVLVPWPGEPLRSRQTVTWRVRVWTRRARATGRNRRRSRRACWRRMTGRPLDRAVRGGARTARRTTGLRPEPGRRRGRRRPGSPVRDRARHLRDLPQRVRVGDVELAPGFTSLRRQPARPDLRRHRTAPSPATNRWEVVLSDGWYRGPHRVPPDRRQLRRHAGLPRPAARRATQTFGTGESGGRPPGPITAADLMAGQVVDLRRAPDRWTSGRVSSTTTSTRLTSSPAPPTRRIAGAAPGRRHPAAPDRQVVDLGQNINGWIRLQRPRPRGDRRSRSPTARRWTRPAT